MAKLAKKPFAAFTSGDLRLAVSLKKAAPPANRHGVAKVYLP
jgi:hypothetical protein